MPEAQFVTVSQAEAGQKLLQFLERRLTGDVPRSAIQRWVRKGQVRVDKGRKKPFDRIEAGQIVRIPPYEPGETAPTSSGGNLIVVYEDDHMLAIAKPAGLAAHGGDKIDDSVAGRLAAKYKDANFMPTLAHRLDRDTSGVLLVAKTYGALRELNDRFASGNIDKLYLAWVNGQWPEHEEVLLKDTMQKQGTPGSQKVHTGSGKVALAKVTGLISGRRHSLVAIRLITGRTHQIRVQLAARGYPIMGDKKYGKGNDRCNLRLHCYAMAIDDKAIVLPPTWGGKWEPSPEILREAQTVLFE